MINTCITSIYNLDRGDIHWTDAETDLQEQLQQLVVDLQPFM